MVNEIITSRTPTFGTVSNDVLRLKAQIRMLQSYVSEHIDISVEEGPNEGNAGPDIIYQCQAAIMTLDKILDDVSVLDVASNRKTVKPASQADESLQ